MSVRRKYVQNALFQLGEVIFFALLGSIYELFSHDVYSYFMIYAFMIPLLLGVLPFLLLSLVSKRKPSQVFLSLWQSGILTLTVGSTFEGVLEIYGTTNHLMVIYPVVGCILLLLALLLPKVLPSSKIVSQS